MEVRWKPVWGCWAWLALAALLAAGCVGAPGPVQERPELVAIRARVGDARAERLVIDVSPGASAPASAAERVAPVAPDATRAGHTVRDAVRALRLFGDVTNGGAADDGAARLEIRPAAATARFHQMDAWWPASFVAWSFGGPLGLLVPDEDWSLDLSWDVTLRAPDGTEVATTRVERRVARTLNDLDRGWSLWDLVFFYATPITPERLERVGRLLLPHAEQDAAVQLCAWLVDEAAPRLPAPPPIAQPAEPAPVEPPPIEQPAEPDPEPPSPAARIQILCIGIGEYAHDAPVRRAAEDAAYFQASLVAALNLPSHDARQIVNKQATEAEIRSWLSDRMRERLGPDDSVVLYFAGRGATAPDGEPYLLPHDARAAEPQLGGVALRDVARAVAGAGSVSIFLDCAFRGRQALRGQHAGDVPADAPRPKPGAEIFPPAMRVLAAAWDEGEAAVDVVDIDRDLSHGVFTWHLPRALRGQRSADRNADGRVTLGEAAEFLAATVEPQMRWQDILERPVRVSGDPDAPLVGPAPRR